MEQMNQELHELRDKLAAKVAEHDKTLAEHDEAISRLRSALGTIAMGLGSYVNGGANRRGRNDDGFSHNGQFGQFGQFGQSGQSGQSGHSGHSGHSGRQWSHEPANRPPRGGASNYKTRGGYRSAWLKSG